MDAPLIEIGGITAETPWMSTIAPSQTIFSYVMNNYWHTNYKADQSGEASFRYAFQPHSRFDALKATRFGMEVSRPLVVAAAAGLQAPAPRLRVTPSTANVETLRPAEDGNGHIVRLFGASGTPTSVSLQWADPAPTAVCLTDASERPIRQVTGKVEVPAWGLVSLLVR